MASCTLELGDRTILLAKGGPSEAEFALFDAGEIELSASGPGQVREVGYRTAVEDALRRLEAVGVTPELAQQAASAMVPMLASTYARGPAARKVASLLGAAELFDGAVYDFELRRYEGRWIDLPALALDLELSRATTLLQALGLAALLVEVDPRTPLVLTTREYAAERRPGERSHKRVPLEHVVNLPAALQTLASRGRRTPNPDREYGPTVDQLLELLELRRRAAADAQIQDRLAAIASAMGLRQRPIRGPLSDPELWSLEEQLTAGNASGVIDHLDAFEKRSGRSPATSYLRARASLLTGREPPRVIAERASGLAMSMASFAECALLAAEAWGAAGEPRRAVPFARDLLSSKDAHADVRARAKQLVEAAERATGRPATAPPPAPSEPAPSPVGPSAAGRGLSSRPPPPRTLPPPVDVEYTARPPTRRISDELTLDVHNPESYPPAHPARRPSPPSARAVRAAAPAAPPPSSGKGDLPPRKATPPLPLGLGAPATDDAFDLPPILAVGAPATAGASATPDVQMPRTPTLGGPPPSSPKERAAAPVEPPLRKVSWDPNSLMRGASQPPFRSDSPGAHAYIPKAPRIPTGMATEVCEGLGLPPGLTGTPAPLESLPSSVLDARVQFTFLARDLAREYREERGVELRVDLASVEAMQAYLFERYPSRKLSTAEECVEVRKHGALLSEILARTLDAFWIDIAPSDLGYWAMLVPPDTRVWPFGRVLRLIAMQHKERDLVSYYLELKARTK